MVRLFKVRFIGYSISKAVDDVGCISSQRRHFMFQATRLFRHLRRRWFIWHYSVATVFIDVDLKGERAALLGSLV